MWKLEAEYFCTRLFSKKNMMQHLSEFECFLLDHVGGPQIRHRLSLPPPDSLYIRSLSDVLFDSRRVLVSAALFYPTVASLLVFLGQAAFDGFVISVLDCIFL